MQRVTGGEPTQEETLLYADSGMLSLLWQRALQLADEFHQRRLDRGGKVLAVVDLLSVAAYYYRLLIKVVAAGRERMAELLGAGVKPEEYITIVSGSLGPKHDDNVTAACELPKAPVNAV